MMILMQAAANGSMSMLLMMVLIFAIMWFLTRDWNPREEYHIIIE